MNGPWWRTAIAAGALAGCLAFSSAALPTAVLTGSGNVRGALPAAAAADDQQPGGSDVEISVTIPATGGQKTTNGQLRWGINTETGSGSFFGGCNFISAGVPGDAGSSRLWTAADDFYRAVDGNVSVQKPTRSGSWKTASWDTRCLDSSGKAVGTAPTERGTGSQVVLGAGTGTVDTAQGTAQLNWEGSFSVVFYGGLTYWWATNPQLSVANGKGVLTAMASGYGSDMNNTAKWVKLAPTRITLATLSNVELGANGITALPDYRSVETTPGRDGAAQVRSGTDWGAFPQSFIDFQSQTGQQAYWYSSGGLRDYAKPATPLYVSYDANRPITVPPPLPAGTASVPGPSAGTTTAPHTVPAAAPLGVAAAGIPLAALPVTAAPAAVAAATWLGTSLIPPAVGQVLADHRDVFLWSLAGLFALTGLALVGFRRGWFVLPGVHKTPDTP